MSTDKPQPDQKADGTEPRSQQVRRQRSAEAETLRRQLLEMEAEVRTKRKRQRRFLGADRFFNFTLFCTASFVKAVYFVGFLLLNGYFILGAVSSGVDRFTIPFFPWDVWLAEPRRTAALIGGGLLGITAWILANIVWRVICEMVLIRFRSYEALLALEEKLQLGELERARERSQDSSG